MKLNYFGLLVMLLFSNSSYAEEDFDFADIDDGFDEPVIEQPILDRPIAVNPIDPIPEQPIAPEPELPIIDPDYPDIIDPEYPIYRPPITILPPRWRYPNNTYWVYPKNPPREKAKPGELLELQIEADERVELLLLDARQETIYEGWLGMGDLRDWKLRFPAYIYLTQLDGIAIRVNGQPLDLTGYSLQGSVSLAVTPDSVR